MLLIEPHYFGSLAFFGAILDDREFTLDIHSHFIKQTYRNRCKLLTPQGVRSLTVPVHYHNRTILRDVKIDYQQNWVKMHLGMLQSAYGKSPFFDFYYPEIEFLLASNLKFLIDLTMKSMTTCLEWMQVDCQPSMTETFVKANPDGINDMRDIIHPKKHDNLADFYTPTPYFQNFGSNFVENLSVLDCLMNCGPECVKILKKSQSAY